MTPVTAVPPLPDTREQLIVQLETIDGQVWEEIEPLQQKSQALEYPIGVYPEVMRLAIEQVRDVVQAPVPLIASSALTAWAIAAQGHFNVARDENLIGPVSLYMLSVGDSGERKSSIDSHFTSPLREFESAERERVKPELQDYHADLQSWEAEKSGVKAGISTAAKGTKSGKPQQSIEELQGRLRELEAIKPKRPLERRVLFQDATPEALVDGLEKKGASAGIVSDEGGSVTGSHGMGKDSQIRNLATLNQLWGGQTITVERMTRESVMLQNPRLSVGLQIQATALADFMRKTGGQARGTGFLARFLIAVPESTQGTRLYRSPPTELQHRDLFNKKITHLLDTPLTVQEGKLQFKTLMLSADAKSTWVNFFNYIEEKLGNGGELHDVRDVASKSAENVARLAALFHLLDDPDGINEISTESVDSAIRIVTWHLMEAQRFFCDIAIPESQQDVVELNNWLATYCENNEVTQISNRNIRRFGPSRIRGSDRLSLAMDCLEKAGRARLKTEGSRKTVHVNPGILRETSRGRS